MRYRGENIDTEMARIIVLNRLLAMEFWIGRSQPALFAKVQNYLMQFLQEIRQWQPRDEGDPPPPWLFDALKEAENLGPEKAPFMRMRGIIGASTNVPRRVTVDIPSIRPRRTPPTPTTSNGRRPGGTARTPRASAYVH